jgi:hypothetical protein
MNLRILLISGCFVPFLTIAMENNTPQVSQLAAVDSFNGSMFIYVDDKFNPRNDPMEQLHQDLNILTSCIRFKEDERYVYKKAHVLLNKFTGLRDALNAVGPDQQKALLKKIYLDKANQLCELSPYKPEIQIKFPCSIQ